MTPLVLLLAPTAIVTPTTATTATTDASAPSASSESDEGIPPREGTPRTRVSLKGAVGAYYGQLFAVHEYGGAAALSAGFGRAKDPLFMGYLTLRVALGRTEHDLAVAATQVGFGPEVVFDRFRLGGELRLGYFSIESITKGGALATGSAGAGIHASFDFADLSSTDTLYVLASAGIDAVEADDQGPPMWTTALNIGYRWDSQAPR